jgi:UDP-N-acetylglucosamine 2-epimerase (non-hydrolysing)
MKKILLVFGTRPEAIKMAPVVRELQKHPNELTPIVCVTGQHRELLDQVLEIFQIEPDYDLNLMKHDQSLSKLSERILSGVTKIIKLCSPDIILVHGDTTTAMVSALAAYYQQIPVGHVEAGLRTNNIYSPFPEEINRQIIGRLASYHYAPTEYCKNNLLDEAVREKKIFVTGNTVIDALYLVMRRIKEDINLHNTIKSTLLDVGYDFRRQVEQSRPLVLITGHRRENYGIGFKDMCKAIKILCVTFPGTDFLFPLHFNPNVRNIVDAMLGEEKYGNLFIINPLSYLTFIFCMSMAKIIITDSGGIQEEAPSLGIPVLVMRNNTERPEAIEAGTAKLVGTQTNKIVSEIKRLLTDDEYYNNMSKIINPYGDGKASANIIAQLLEVK